MIVLLNNVDNSLIASMNAFNQCRCYSGATPGLLRCYFGATPGLLAGATPVLLHLAPVVLLGAT